MLKVPLKVPLGHFLYRDHNVYVDGLITRIEYKLSPLRPRHLHVTFTRTPHMLLPVDRMTATGTFGGDPLMNVIGTLTIDPAVPSDNVTARVASVVLDGAAPILVDLMSGTGTFECMIGQDYSIHDIDTNVTGDSPPSNVLTGTVPAFGSIPATPTGLTVTFAPTP